MTIERTIFLGPVYEEDREKDFLDALRQIEDHFGLYVRSDRDCCGRVYLTPDFTSGSCLYLVER